MAGSYDQRKHKSVLEAAQHELSEEARLKGGEWINLLPANHSPDGISELKWGKNRFIPYLCLDPIEDENPLERDAEEYIQVVKDVIIDHLESFITQGEMMLPSVQTSWMALSYLRKNNFL